MINLDYFGHKGYIRWNKLPISIAGKFPSEGPKLILESFIARTPLFHRREMDALARKMTGVRWAFSTQTPNEIPYGFVDPIGAFAQKYTVVVKTELKVFLVFRTQKLEGYAFVTLHTVSIKRF